MNECGHCGNDYDEDGDNASPCPHVTLCARCWPTGCDKCALQEQVIGIVDTYLRRLGWRPGR